MRKPKTAVASAMLASEPARSAKVRKKLAKRLAAKKGRSPLKAFGPVKGTDGKYRFPSKSAEPQT